MLSNKREAKFLGQVYVPFLRTFPARLFKVFFQFYIIADVKAMYILNFYHDILMSSAKCKQIMIFMILSKSRFPFCSWVI